MDQLQRLNYTRRDLLTLHEEVNKYLKEFIPTITDTSQMNTGRLYLTLIEAQIDNANYAIDQAHIESLLQTTRQRKNILKLAYFLGYSSTSVAASSVDLTFSMLSGVAPVGGQSVPIYTRCQTVNGEEFITIEAGSIPEGEVSADIQAVQGIRIQNEVLTSSASGEPNQSYQLANVQTPHSFIEIRVNGVLWDVVESWADSESTDREYKLEFDEDDRTSVLFGDDVFGAIPQSGDQITATYIYTLAENGNAAAGAISRVIGSLASLVGVTNAEASTAGSISETDDSIKVSAPATRRSSYRIVTRIDHETHAKAVEGVFDAYAKHGEGARTDVYIMPQGGGEASSFLVSQVQERFDERKIEGAIPVASALTPANILITINVVTYDTRIKKATVKAKVREDINEALLYTNIKRGRGFTLSDISNIVENVDNGTLIDYVDFVILSRVPNITKSNALSPDIINRVAIASNVGYSTYLITAISTTQFTVSVNGVPEAINGTVAVEYTTADGAVTFTLGRSSDTFTVGDTWRFKTSKYRDNMYLDEDEAMRLQYSNDLVINAYYPGEYDITSE